MPYVTQRSRWAVDSRGAVSPGELNYEITAVLTKYLGQSPQYHHINDALGALECAKLELYRRIAVPYEDRKCAENGDVYEVR